MIMTGLKRLEIEYDGINGIIREYTKDAIVVNYLAKLIPTFLIR